MMNAFRLLRPAQWMKNGFVFMPLIFSKHLFEKIYYVDAIIAFVTFCFASSLVYIINDIVDVEADKLHPEKKNRPIASDQISVLNAVILGFVLGSITIFLASTLPNEFLYTIALYLAVQTAYSFSLKHIVILDIFIIATGFMLRVFGGAFAIQVVISHWIVITTLFLSLFLAASKRRAELVLIRNQHIDTKRKVLQEYSIQFLDALLVITSTGMAISYSLYTMAEKTISVFGSEYLIFTIIFVLFGIFRYLFLVIVKDQGENPTSILMHDNPTSINLFLWVLACVMIIYFS